MVWNVFADLSISFIRLLVGIQIFWYYAESTKIEIGKFRTYKNMKIAPSISSTEEHIDRSHMECSRRLLSKDDICVASYNTVTRTCMLYAYGCSPSFNVSNTGTCLIRRDLSGFIQDNEDCSYYKNTNDPSGVFTIQPEGVNTGIAVYCDMNTDNGGWILIQNRYDGSVNFYQTWNQYKNGFGSLSGEFWIGNDNLHTLTYSNKYMLRVDLTDSFGNQTYAEYYIFRVSDEADKYRLIIGEYYGDAGDAMYYNNNQIFHTKDQDSTVGFNGRVCSLDRYAGFWFDRCTWANPNGRWLPGIAAWDSIHWYQWLKNEGLSKISMKIRRK
ncbi:fibrinogen-like protein A [Mytilus californianus]|uniref:fibrinogen-like protein A n=1 Tax=Mytilus californianus TaxID=6549 RepID=UPI0022475E3E|nr:fibrinogen-like protein A [Mytilus californianus]